MVKPRNLLIIIIISFVLIVLLSLGLEGYLLQQKADSVTTMVKLAGDMALKTATVSEEFFRDEATYGYTDSKVLTINADSGISRDIVVGGTSVTVPRSNSLLVANASNNGFVYRNIFQNTFPSATDRGYVYRAMFLTKQFVDNYVTPIVNNKYVRAEQAIPYVSDSGNIQTLYAPKLYAMGYSQIANLSSTFRAQQGYSLFTTAGTAVAQSSTDLKDKLSAVDYWSYTKTGSFGGNNADGSVSHTYKYTLSPTALGYTYLDEAVLDNAFRINMDLLMRAKYINGTSLSGYDAWLDHSFFDETSNKAKVSSWASQVVNNGQFYYIKGKPLTYVRNNVTTGTGGTSGTVDVTGYYFDGQELRVPKIEYMLIDAYNGVNNDILQQAIGASMTDSKTGLPTTDIATALKNNDTSGAAHKMITVAKVTFFADFVIPFDSSSIRGMRKYFDSQTGEVHNSKDNLGNLVISKSSLDSALSMFDKNSSSFNTEQSKIGNGYCYAYTTYFTVAD